MLAGIFILAHLFIPHTHHENHICIINSPCYNQQVSLQSGAGHSDNRKGHSHVSAEFDSRLIAAEFTENNYQTVEWEFPGNPFSTENAGNPDPEETHADDTKNGIGETGHSDKDEAVCRHSIHSPLEESNHSHDGHCHTDDCALFEILVYDPQARKPVIECSCIEYDHNHSELVQAVLQAGLNPPPGRHNLPYRQKPYIDTCSGYNHSLIPGLRAPPAC